MDNLLNLILIFITIFILFYYIHILNINSLKTKEYFSTPNDPKYIYNTNNKIYYLTIKSNENCPVLKALFDNIIKANITVKKYKKSIL